MATSDDDARTFLRALTAGASAAPTTYFYLWHKSTRITTSFVVQDPQSVVAATTWTETPSDLHVGVALGATPVDRHKRLKGSDARGLFGVWTDIDIAGPGHAKSNLPPNIDAAWDLVEEFGAPPTLVVASGHGAQPWWLFPEPWIFANRDEAAAAVHLTKDWVSAQRRTAEGHGWDLDSVGDHARLLRLPGTVNAKIAGAPADVVLVTASGPRYNREELGELIERSRRGSSAPVASRTPAPETEASFTVSGDAEPPPEKLAALLGNEHARGSWNHDRPEFQDRVIK